MSLVTSNKSTMSAERFTTNKW